LFLFSSVYNDVAHMGLTVRFGLDNTGIMLQLSGNRDVQPQPVAGTSRRHRRPASLKDLRRGDEAILERIDLPEDDARRLMELGFLPGSRVVAAWSAPGGDPRVFRVDGSEIALRRETAAKIYIRVPENK
jgi:ferrous iron transport protein A